MTKYWPLPIIVLLAIALGHAHLVTVSDARLQCVALERKLADATDAAETIQGTIAERDKTIEVKDASIKNLEGQLAEVRKTLETWDAEATIEARKTEQYANLYALHKATCRQMVEAQRDGSLLVLAGLQVIFPHADLTASFFTPVVLAAGEDAEAYRIERREHLRTLRWKEAVERAINQHTDVEAAMAKADAEAYWPETEGERQHRESLIAKSEALRERTRKEVIAQYSDGDPSNGEVTIPEDKP